MTHLIPRHRAVALAVLATAAGASGALASTASAGFAGTRTCHGLPVTVKASKGLVIGTSGRDVIALTGPATVYAGKGDDIICGSSGNDTIDAGTGEDAVLGRGGDDRLVGGPGRDRLYGEQGRDTLVGGPGADVLMGGSGRDRVVTDRSRHGNELSAPMGDTLVPGTDAISFVATSRSWPDLSAFGLSTQWVTGSQFTPVVGEVVPPSFGGPATTPLAASIAFPQQVGAYFAPVAAADPFQVAPGTGITPQGQVAFAVGGQPSQADEMANALTAQSDGAWPSTMSATPAIGGSWIGGFTQDTVVDGQDLGQLPVSAQSGMSFTEQQPTQVWLSLGASSLGYGSWTAAQPVPAMQGVMVDFSGPDEVVGVSYDRSTGFSQG